MSRGFFRKRHATLIPLLLVCIFILLMVPFTHAQDEEANPTSDIQAVEAIATIEALRDEIQGLTEQNRLYIDDVELLTENISATTAFDYIGAITNILALAGGVVAVGGAIAGYIFWRRLQNAQSELVNTKAETEKLQEQLLQATAKAEEQANQISEQRKHVQLASTLISLADDQRATGDLYGAIRTYKRSLQLDDRNPFALYNMGYIYTELKRLDDAEDRLTEALEIDPQFHHARAALGFVYRRRGDNYRYAAKEAQDNATADALRSQYEAEYRKAENLLTEALEEVDSLVDADGEAWAGSLGGLHFRRGDYKQAMKYYKLAAEVTPYSSYPLLNIGRLHLRANNAEYIQCFQRVARLARRQALAKLTNYWKYGDIVTSGLIVDDESVAVENALKSIQELVEVLPESLDDILPRIGSGLLSVADDLENINQKSRAKLIRAFVDENIPAFSA